MPNCLRPDGHESWSAPRKAPESDCKAFIDHISGHRGGGKTEGGGADKSGEAFASAEVESQEACGGVAAALTIFSRVFVTAEPRLSRLIGAFPLLEECVVIPYKCTSLCQVCFLKGGYIHLK